MDLRIKFVVLLQVFCFLPLPIHTKLPVHINGHFALDHEARRGLWRDDDGLCFNFNSYMDALLIQQCHVLFVIPNLSVM